MRLEASVIIPSYQNKDALLRCLEHLARQSFPADRFEVVVVVDGSTDGSAAAARAFPASALQLKVLEQPNAGRAAALNRAARAAASPLLIVTDSDVIPNLEFVQSHVEAHAHADVVIGPIPLSERSPRDFLTDGVRRWAERHEREMRDKTSGFVCSQIYGANLSIPRERFLAIGGYRTDLRRTEDFQLGKKILDAGLSVRFCPGARAEHVYDKTMYEWCRDFHQDGISHTRFAQEFPEEIPHLRLGRFHPESPVKRTIRPLVVEDRWLGRLFVSVSTAVLERARRLGFRGRFWSAWKGVLGDSVFWKGVRHELGDPARYRALTEASRGRRSVREDLDTRGAQS